MMREYALWQRLLLGMGISAGLAAATAGPAAGQTAPAVRVAGVVYTQYAYQLADSAAHTNNFEVARAYVNVLGTFEKGIKTRVTSDVFRNADGSLGMRLKYAFATWKPSGSPLTAKLGMIQTPWLDWEETLWEYRMQSPMMLDRNGYLTSADLGIGADGAFGAQQLLNFQVAVVNGEGYSKPGGDGRKDVQGRGSLRLLGSNDTTAVGGLRVTGYAHLGGRTGGGARDRFIGMLSYKSKLFTLAGEVGRTRDGSDTTATKLGNLIGALGVLRVADSPWALIARVDVVDPDDGQANDGFTTVIGGVSYQLSSNVRLLADIDHTDYQADMLPVAVNAGRSKLLLQAQFVF